MHGWFDEPESAVLGLSSYAKVASHAHTKAVLQLFTLAAPSFLLAAAAL